MAKYKIPVQAISYVEIEADNLEQAVKQVNHGEISIPGIDKSKVSNWEVDQWSIFEKDDQIVVDEDDSCLYLSDILDHSKY